MKISNLFYAVLTAVFGVSIASCSSSECSQGGDFKCVSQAYDDFNDFDELEISGVFDVDIVCGLDYSVKVDIPKNMSDKLSVSVQGGCLKVKLDCENMDIRDAKADYKLSISMPTLKSLTLAGMADVDLKGKVDADFKASIAGMSELDIEHNQTLKSLSLSCAGMSEISFEDIVVDGDASFNVSGQSELEGDRLVVKKIVASVSWMSDFELEWLDADGGRISSSGMSSVKLEGGNHRNVSVSASGMSYVKSAN